jgi:hypothetical protein
MKVAPVSAEVNPDTTTPQLRDDPPVVGSIPKATPAPKAKRAALN